jgi:predicted dehydrogenase
MNKEKPLITGMDGFKALQIAEASLKSSATGRIVKLKSSSDHAILY